MTNQASMNAKANATGQVTGSAAEIYEQLYVPALFATWTAPMLDAAGVTEGARVLDVACGTGVLARAMLQRVGARGSVSALDVNQGMLAVARARGGRIDWQQGRAEALPYADATFDAVCCQFGLMFFEDRVAALHEMRRVLRPGGRLALAVWDSLEHTPAYARVVSLLQRHFGQDAADAMRAPFALGERAVLSELLARAGFAHAEVVTHAGVARFPSLSTWVYTDVKGWTAADLVDEAGYARLLADATHELASFVRPDASVEFSAPAHIVSELKPVA